MVSENSQVDSYAWPLYIELRTTTATAANQNSSQSAGATVRMFASSAGSPWNTAFHAEAQHGWSAGVHFPALTAAEIEAARGSDATLGGAAIAIEAPYEVGLSLGPNDLRLTPGRRIILDEEHGVWLTYNRQTTRVEIHREGKLAAAL